MAERCMKVINRDHIGHSHFARLSNNKDYKCEHFKKTTVTKIHELFGYKMDKQYCTDCKFYHVDTYRTLG